MVGCGLEDTWAGPAGRPPAKAACGRRSCLQEWAGLSVPVLHLLQGTSFQGAGTPHDQGPPTPASGWPPGPGPPPYQLLGSQLLSLRDHLPG